MTTLKPSQPPPTWKHSATDIVSLTKAGIEKNREVHDSVAALSPADCNFTSVYVALASTEAELKNLEPLLFYKNVSTEKDIRDAATEADNLVKNFSVEAEMRLDVFNAKKAASDNIAKEGAPLNAEEKRLVEKMLLDGKRAGLDLPEAQRDELTRLKKELSQVCVKFNQNFNEEDGKILFTLEELKGVPADVISGFPKQTEDTKELYEVTHKTTDIFPIFKYAENPETRRRMRESFDGRLSINVDLFDQALSLRRQIAAILGYDSWADYITEVKMVKSAHAVDEFLDDLEKKMRQVGIKNLETLLALKKEEHGKKGMPFDGEFYAWDYSYYDRKFVETELKLDDSLVKEYFPVTVVVPAILRIYRDLLGVRFQEISYETWHPDVQQFAVWEKDAKDESGFVGYFYLDLYPRPAKYSHAAVWCLIPGYDLPNGKHNYPVAAMVANLAKPTPDRPALMRHGDVVTFFHEMGHIFHELLSKTRFSRFHGTSVALDFGEAPSQMLENWCWEPRVLQLMSSHYKTQEPLPVDLITKINKSRYVNVGLFYLRQLFFAKFDIKVHTDKEATDYTLLWNELRQSITLLKSSGDLMPGQATFAHLTGGYEAGYYGYIYSLVFAMDMYATVFKRDPLDPESGRLYREKILLPGSSRDENEFLKDFLGRAPNSNAFIEEIFGTSASRPL
ncbi:Metalloprotease [Rickenella mellea]|uniref:Metalloprotease n=1 Tax=Rickenella mellea TaxID=50990 RepID=A0A4Y7Q5P4_9AGAM|nr:Metalloprotease [Rickenella mellea]